MNERTCKRGHIVTGKNAKRRPSNSKYLACRQCERDAQKNRRSLRKSLKERQ